MKTGRMLPLLMCMLAMALWGCPPSKKENPPPPTPPPGLTSSAKGTLSFDDDVVSWITTSNYFAQLRRPSIPPWFGVLFQFGAFNGSTFRGGVKFKAPDGTLLTTAPLDAQGRLAGSLFTWVNIVSNRPGVDTPVLPDEVVSLFPNTASPHPCDMGSTGNNCLRDRRIHWDQPHIDFIITYWQADHGFVVESVPDEDHPGNKVKVNFPDDFAVDAYQLDATGAWTPVLHFESGAVGSLEVVEMETGTHGGKHDPTWEIPATP